MKFEHQITENMFGTQVVFETIDQKHKYVVELETNPFEKLMSVSDGFLFKAPNLPDSILKPALASLSESYDPFDFSLSWDEKNNCLTSLVRFSDMEDAASFSMAHARYFQKWSDEKELESQKERKPLEFEDILDEEGNLVGKRVQIEVSTIDDLV